MTTTFVIDKPVGVAAHPQRGLGGPSVLGHLAAAGCGCPPPGVPGEGNRQRLDVGTSGLMVVAKSELAYTVLKRAFRSRDVEKPYHTLVQGHPDPFTGTIDAPIGRHPGADYKMAVISGGRPSITHYETLEAFVGTTLLEVNLETGRTHQIRVRFAACDIRVSATSSTARSVLADRLGRSVSGCMPYGSHPPTGHGQAVVQLALSRRPEARQTVSLVGVYPAA
jgi:23S rRNA pseudouridine1911/1915/1917 synthase